MKKIICIILVMLSTATHIIAQQKEVPKLTGSYLGQKPPGIEPEIFALGIVSSEHFEHGITINVQVDEIYFTRRTNVDDGNRIFYTKLIEGK